MEVQELCPREGPGWAALATQASQGLLAPQAATSGPSPLPCQRQEGQPRGCPRTSCRSPRRLWVRAGRSLGSRAGPAPAARTSEGHLYVQRPPSEC